jgi:hypothetical protein
MGLIMTTGLDQAHAEERDQAGLDPVSDLPPMTPETARRLATILAPHFVAMRAITAGTRYEDSADIMTRDTAAGNTSARDAAAGNTTACDATACDDVLGGHLATGVQMSPATKIFIAGMLDRLPA